jgi:GNAT superfamily N-acetyltransferase
MKENNIASIYSPREKIEGIHKLRPEGVRSIYLDRTPRKALEKKAFEIEYTKDKSYKGEHERVNLRDKDGSLAAYMTTRPDPAKRQNVTAISSLYVDPRYRGKGLAKKLLDIAKSKHSNLVLRAKPFKDKPLNTDALKGLYGKHGFMPASGITKKEKSSDDIMFYKKASRNILNKIAPRVQDMHGIVSSKKRKEKEKEKIYKKARAPRPKTYAVDFDGTIVDNAFPRIGKPKKKTIDFIKKVHSRGDRVVIWTSRGGKTLGYMQNFLDKHKVPYHEINTNSKFQTGSPKIVADYYIDDKAVHVDDLHKIAAIPGSVPRIMSGLINKKVMAAPPLKPKLSTIPRASVPGGTSIANKKIAKEDFVMNLMEKLAARGFKYKRNKDYESQTRGKRPRTEMNFRKPVIKTEAKGLIPFLKKNKRGAIIGAGLGLAAGTGAALYNRNKEASDFIDDEFEKIAGAKLEAAKGAMSKIKNFLNRDVKYLGKRVGKASEKESFPTTNPLKAKIKTDGVAKKVEKEVAKEAPVAKKVESFSAKSPKDLANEAKTNKPNQQKTYPTENVNKAKPKVEPQRAYSTVNPNKVKPEPPKAAIPKMETPKTEAPKAEAPKPEAPKTEAPKTEAPKAEAPGTEKSKSKLTWKGKLGLGAGVAATGAGLGYASGSNEDKAASDFIDEAFEKTSGTAWKKYLAKPKNLGIAERVKATKDMDIKKIPGIEYNMDEIARAKIKGDIASKRDRILNSMR